jgi:xylulokinase/glycerol kinase
LSRKRDLRFPPLIRREKDGGLPPGTSEKAASSSKVWRGELGNSLIRFDYDVVLFSTRVRDDSRQGELMEADSDLVAAVDIGTSGCKVLFFNPFGKIVSSGFVAYLNRQIPPDRVEQDPEVWWDAACRASSQALEGIPYPEQVKAVAVTGQRASAIPVDGKGKPLRPAIQTQDKRSTPQCDDIRGSIGEDEIYRRTGLIIDPYFVAPKILWIKDEEPSVFARAHKFLTVQDLVLHHLCGEFAIDFSQASRTMLFNIASKGWDCRILEGLGIPLEKLPDVYPSGSVVGELTLEAAEATGFREGIPVVAAGGDQPCAALGIGAVEPHILSATTGTGTYVLALRSQPELDPKRRFLCSCHVLPDLWAIEAGILVTGAALSWFLKNFCQVEGEEEDPYCALEDMAKESPIGANGLLFIPHFAGSASPYWNPKARGCLHGLTMGHTRGDVARSLVEGIFLEVKKNIDLLSASGVKGIEVRVSGGVTKSDFFNQLQADIYGCLFRRAGEETTSLGAAILAGAAIGWYRSIWEGLRGVIGEDEMEVKHPDPKSHRQYQQILKHHHELYMALHQAFPTEPKS